MRYKISVDWEDLENLMREQLREDYIGTVTTWKTQPDSEQLGEALLEVIKYYSAPSEFETWYETIKDL